MNGLEPASCNVNSVTKPYLLAVNHRSTALRDRTLRTGAVSKLSCRFRRAAAQRTLLSAEQSDQEKLSSFFTQTRAAMNQDRPQACARWRAVR